MSIWNIVWSGRWKNLTSITHLAVFKITWIILLTQKIRDNNFRIILLTREYWKISCWHKTKWLPYDLWDIVHASIERNWVINHFKQLERIESLGWMTWSYASIIEFLWLLSLLHEFLADGMSYPSLFDDYGSLFWYIKWGGHTEVHHFLLLKIRTLKTLWVLNPNDINSTPVLRYIYHNIRSSPIHKIVTSKPLDIADLTTLQVTIENTLHQAKI